MSDQDNFFDEEPEAKSTPSKSAKAPVKPSPKSAATPVTPAVDPTPSYAIAALVGVIGLLLGAILGFLLGTTLAGNSAPAASNAPAPATSTQPAPQLTTEQINAGELPAGHPAVNASGAAETTTK